MTKPFRFGVQSFSANSGQEWAERAQRAEQLGYSAFHLADHIIGEGPALERSNHPLQTLAAVPAMAYATAVTSKIKIGCRVFCVDYHDPTVLIKEAMTIDVLSGGRLEFGLGAGWLKDEYAAMGLSMDSPGTRIKRLADVIKGVKAYAADEPLDIHNDTLHWSDFTGSPKPIQKPHPPILIGGGAPKILGLAGAEADIVSLNFNNASGLIGPAGVNSSTADETKKKIEWIKAGAGERFNDLEIEVGAYFTFVMDDASEVLSNFAAMFGLSTEQMAAHPHALFGNVDTICEELQRRRDAYGISYITVGDSALEAFAPVVEKLSGQ